MQLSRFSPQPLHTSASIFVLYCKRASHTLQMDFYSYCALFSSVSNQGRTKWSSLSFSFHIERQPIYTSYSEVGRENVVYVGYESFMLYTSDPGVSRGESFVYSVYVICFFFFFFFFFFFVSSKSPLHVYLPNRKFHRRLLSRSNICYRY